MTERQYLVLLYSFIPFGPKRIGLLVNYFGKASKVWKSSINDLEKVGIKPSTACDFKKYRESFNHKDYFKNLIKNSVFVLTKDDEEYPDNLRDLEDAPNILYVKGKLSKNDANAVAIVGSRKMTSYGREVTEKFAIELASLGITIVSGLAFGVDLCAHKSSLDVKGRCIAVLASGLDQITPRSNEWLGIKIIKSGGALVSEYPLGTVPQRSFFPYRNRIISGLSKAVIVVEGMIKSGTIHTALHAAKQGREVFAVPGQITSPTSGAPHYLIQNGARMITNTNDVIRELNLALMVDKEQVAKVLPDNNEEEKLLEILNDDEFHLDEIVRISGMSTQGISATLTIMEMKGQVKNLGGGIYKKI